MRGFRPRPKYDSEEHAPPICIVDFAGNYKHDGFWCDYYPNVQLVEFGGKWCNIPDWEIDYCPTEEQVMEYIENLKNPKEVFTEPYTTPLFDWREQ